MPHKFQEQTRKKRKWIRCPKCNSPSVRLNEKNVSKWTGNQLRLCKKCNHIFLYDYIIQAILQDEVNCKLY